ncbi:MAG: inositol monophosphatase [Vicinamibacteria bacterium]|nr:inositol monophosphatase [Vicinamibacteria bacterium]
MNTSSFANVAAEAVLAAGVIQAQRRGQAIEIQHKGVVDLVTEVDRASEDAILRVLRERFPDHDIVTEETDLARTGSEWVWYVDPLDGTTNYAHGYPFYCASVGLTRNGERIAGAVYDPVKEELFTAERGAGAFLNGRRLRCTQTSELLQSLLVTGFPYDFRDDVDRALVLFRALIARARAIRRDGAAALDLAYMAAGRIDAFWEERLKPWDVMAGALMVEEAGGRASRFDGTPMGVAADEVLVSNGPLHPALLEVIAEARRVPAPE